MKPNDLLLDFVYLLEEMMLLRKAFITYFSQPTTSPCPPPEGDKGEGRGIWLLLCSVILFCTVSNSFAGGDPVKGEEKEKSELAVLMIEIDKDYKVLERLSTYFTFEEVEKEQKVYGDASANLMALCKTATTNFARPDDDKYQELNHAMLMASENIDGVFKNKNIGITLEDVLWQVGLLRQTCADCHKHLDIKLGTGKQGK
ncbi:MAG: hypothetical protein FJ264_16435 [Planctomycetes bacterium]|nr:hypothetical protein [Planctomycetota bacterium]